MRNTAHTRRLPSEGATRCVIAGLFTVILLSQSSCHVTPTGCLITDITCNPLVSLIRGTAGAAGGSRWLSYDPRSVSGLRFWINAEGIAQGNGTALNSWTDQSGTGNSLGLGLAPTFYSTANTINGRPVVTFVSASGTQLVKAAPTGLSASDSGSILAVLRLNGAANMEVISVGGCGSQGRQISVTNSGTNLEVNKFCVGQVANPGIAWAVGAVHQFTVLQNLAASILMKLDGTIINNTVPALNSYGAGSLTIGQNANMDLAELLFYDNRISDQNASDIECYLGARFGTLNCP